MKTKPLWIEFAYIKAVPGVEVWIDSFIVELIIEFSNKRF